MNKLYGQIFAQLFLISITLSLQAQQTDSCHLSDILKNQKKYYRTLNRYQKKQYQNLLYLAPHFRPGVIAEISRLYPAYEICSLPNINILEIYDSPHGDIFGLIWADSLFFKYTSGPSIKTANRLVVHKIQFSSLDDEFKDIVLHFNDWGNVIFRNKETSAHRTSPSPFYLASKISFSNKKSSVQTIAFCY
jgi:hypothetical protein